ncbi:MAG: AAA family ATPase [Candidatus Omnitrophota bacterium]|jgi:CO dehydrogenase maturation factor
MGRVIAFAGKGGTGKTTTAALLVRIIKEKKLGSVLVVDADPNNNLAEILGLTVKQTIGSILDDITASPEKVPPGMTKDRFIEYKVQAAVEEGDGFDLLTMGRPEGPGCYCYVNNVLRNVMSNLIKDYDYVIIDNEAGLEHLSRRTTKNADAMVIVSDASAIGLKAAGRIVELTKELKIGVRNSFLLVSRASTDIDKKKIRDFNFEYLGFIPQDSEIEKLSLAGLSLMNLKDDSISLNHLRKLGEKIWQRN